MRSTAMFVLATLALSSGACGAQPDAADVEDPQDTSEEAATAAFSIKSTLTGKCVDGNVRKLQTPYLFPCNTGNPFQRWVRTDKGLLKNVGSGYCLDGYGGGKPYFFDCDAGNDNQKWKRVPLIPQYPDPRHLHQNAASRKCLDASSGNLTQATCDRRAGQVWNAI